MECRSRGKIKARDRGCGSADKDSDTEVTITHQLLYKVLELLEEPSQSSSSSSTSKASSRARASTCNCQPVLNRILEKCMELEQSLNVIRGQLAVADASVTTTTAKPIRTEPGAPARKSRSKKVASTKSRSWEDSDPDWGDNGNDTDTGNRVGMDMDEQSDFGEREDANTNTNEHEDTKPYLCKLCPISFFPKPVFSDPRDLAEHYSSQHQIPEPFGNGNTGRIYRNRTGPPEDFALVSATAGTNWNRLPENSGAADINETYLCDECGGDFVSKEGLKQHKNRMHGKGTTSTSGFQPKLHWKRGRGRDRKWVKKASFPGADSAYAALKGEKMWRTRRMYNTKGKGKGSSVLKQTYDCKVSRLCGAKAMLSFTHFNFTEGTDTSRAPAPSQAGLVTLHKTDAAHSHDTELLDERKNGMLSDVKKIISELLDEGVTKPTLIMDELATRGARRLPSVGQLVNYLKRAKRARGMPMTRVRKKATTKTAKTQPIGSNSATSGQQTQQMEAAGQNFTESAVLGSLIAN